MRVANPLARDLDLILEHTRDLWEQLRGQHIFITGGTGFFGCWLLESFIWANDKFGLNANACVLTRNPAAFRHKVPHLANHPSIGLWPGDARTFEFPEQRFSHVIHAAAEMDTVAHDELTVMDIIVQGSRRALELARRCDAQGCLLTSSGAVYGQPPSEQTHIPETYGGAPSTTTPGSAYGEAKRIAELEGALYQARHGLPVKIARCFAFVGPYLPLDGRYAIGNFIRDGLNGTPIRVNGDGAPYRSYLYAADLAIWLWTILLRGEVCQPYNVGSEDGLTIAELAATVATLFEPKPDVLIARAPVAGTPVAGMRGASHRYVPSTQLAQQTLNLRQTVDLKEAIRRTIRYNQPDGRSNESN